MLLHSVPIVIVVALVIKPLFTPPLLALGLTLLVVFLFGVGKGVRGAKGVARFLLGLVVDVVMATVLFTFLDWRLAMPPTTTPNLVRLGKYLALVQPATAVLIYTGLPIVALVGSSLGISFGFLIARKPPSARKPESRKPSITA